MTIPFAQYVRNVVCVLKEYNEEKRNEGKLQASSLWCFGSWVHDYCALGLEFQSWYVIITLLWVFWELQVIFPFENQAFGAQSWIRKWKHLKAEAFFLIRDGHRQWVSGKEFRLHIKGWLSNVKLLLWSTFILANNLVRVFLHTEESTGTAHPHSPKAALGWFGFWTVLG